MKRTRAKRFHAILFTAALLSVLLAAGCASPPRIDRPEAEIRAELLKNVPIGSPVAKVESYIKSVNEKGVVTQGAPPGDLLARAGGAGNPPTAGVQATIYVGMGEYYMLPLDINVMSFWLIDGNGKLADIWVLKKQSQL